MLKSYVIYFILIGNLARLTAAQPYQQAILNNQNQLEYIKGRVEAGVEPWKSAFAKMQSDGFASLIRSPRPRANVDCGYYSMPDVGCSDEKDDAKAAYTQALLWMFTGKVAHASKSAAILDAWSTVLESHTNNNAPLQASWVAPVFVRAAMILRNTYPAWGEASRNQFQSMMNKAFLPLVRNGAATRNGNWELSFIEATLSIAIFNEDSIAFNQGVSLWRKRVPAYFYLTSDGPLPLRPANTKNFDDPTNLIKRWYSPKIWPNGLCQETCRDFGHTQMGLAALINGAEIAFHQRIDLYGEEADRIIAGMEFHARILLGNSPPAGLCGGKLAKIRLVDTWEIGYNHFHNRMGREMPFTKQLIISKIRPSGHSTHHMIWETMTHGELGKEGVMGIQESVGRPDVKGYRGLTLLGNSLSIIRDGVRYSLEGKRLSAQ